MPNGETQGMPTPAGRLDVGETKARPTPINSNLEARPFCLKEYFILSPSIGLGVPWVCGFGFHNTF